MRRILVIQTAFIGDAILTLPMIQKLKEMNPDSAVDVICTPVTKEIFESSESVDKIIPLDKRGEHKSVLALYKLCQKLALQKYSKIYSPHKSFRSSLVVMFMKVRETYGFSNSSFRLVYKHLVRYDSAAHEVKRCLNLINAKTEGDEWKILPKVSITDHSKNKVAEFRRANNLENYIVLAPESVWQTKIYPSEYFKTIAKHYAQKQYKVVLMGGEKDRIKLKEFLDLDSRIISAAGQFSLVESVELLSHAKILISNDSAPTHLALCADIPVLTLFCSTVPGFGFYPYSSKSAYMSIEGLKCKPCGIHGKNICPINTFECGYKLTPDLVIKKSEEMINE